MTDNRTGETAIRGRWLVLFMLFIVYAVNFLDRQILSILKEPIAAELGLNDEQLGLMGGLAFALLYTTLAVPAAWLADRTSRVWIITGALALWSGFTALCGLAANFWQLFAARMGVGVGEAGGVAPAYSLIADYFPPPLRARAMAVFSFGIPVGSACGVLAGGLLAAHVDWRWAFFAIGAGGLLLAPLLRLAVKEPVRARQDAAPPESMRFGAVVRLAASKPSFWLMSLGTACASMVGYGIMYWMPTFLARSLGMDMVSRSWLFAGILLIGGLVGMTLALAAAKQGIASHVVDRADPAELTADGFDGRASAISTASWNLFCNIGLGDRLEPYGCPIDSIAVTDAMRPGHDYVLVARRDCLHASFSRLTSALKERIERRRSGPPPRRTAPNDQPA